MKSFAACLLLVSAFASESEMFNTRSPIYGGRTYKTSSYKAPKVAKAPQVTKAPTPPPPPKAPAPEKEESHSHTAKPAAKKQHSYGFGSFGHSSYGGLSKHTMHMPSMFKMNYADHTPAKHYGSHYVQDPFAQQPKEKTPLEKLTEENDAQKVDIQANKQAIAMLKAHQSKLVYDYFYVNDAKYHGDDGRIKIRGDNQFETLMDPGVFCADAGDTVEIYSNISIDTNDYRAITVLEIRRDGERVAVSGDFQGYRGPQNQSVYWKETLSSDASFDIRIRVANDSALLEKLELQTVQTGIEIWHHPDGMGVTEMPPSCAS